MLDENSREYKAAKAIEQAVNCYGFDNEKFAQTIGTFHKTLEQNFMRLLIECIRYMAKSDNRFIDPRNKGAHEAAVILNQALEDNKDKIYLPYI